MSELTVATESSPETGIRLDQVAKNFESLTGYSQFEDVATAAALRP